MTALVKQLQAARQHNAHMDAIDRRGGFATPAQVGFMEVAGVAYQALLSALITRRWGAVAEAAVLLEALPGVQAVAKPEPPHSPEKPSGAAHSKEQPT